jgi:mRNA-degrading endonuclease YafQ of YafQ-DinJ toxin-antitoxin module
MRFGGPWLSVASGTRRAKAEQRYGVRVKAIVVQETPRIQYLPGRTLMDAVNMLAADQPLPERLRDHPLSGEW